MKSNPYLHALAATAYIGGIGLLFRYISSVKQNTPDNILDPIAVLSVLVFSVAVMGYIFFYRPAMLLVDGKKSEAIAFFLKTLITFGAITLLVVAILLFVF